MSDAPSSFEPPSPGHRPEPKAPRYRPDGERAPTRFLRGSQATGGSDSGAGESEALVLFEGLSQAHRVLDPGFFEDKSLLSDLGAEHKVFLRENREVLKYTWPGTFGFIPTIEDGRFSTEEACADGYLWRIGLQNKIFGDEIHVEGIIYLPYEKGLIEPMGNFGWAMVTSQPFRHGIAATDEAIAQFMRENGFRKATPFHTWYRPEDGILASDAHLGNFVDVGGNLFPIDLHLNQLPIGSFAAAGWPE